MLFFSLVVSLSLRYNLSIVITQMVNVPNVNNKTTVDVSFCPIENATNFIDASMTMSNANHVSERNQTESVFLLIHGSISEFYFVLLLKTFHFVSHLGHWHPKWQREVSMVAEITGYHSVVILLGLHCAANAGRCVGAEIWRQIHFMQWNIFVGHSIVDHTMGNRCGRRIWSDCHSSADGIVSRSIVSIDISIFGRMGPD